MRKVHTGILALGLASSPRAQAEPLRPTAVLAPERGFIDDALALSPDGATLYYVVTDGATFAELRTAKLGKGAAAPEVTVPGLKITTTALVPLSEGRVLVIETEPEGQRRKSGQVYSLPKKMALPQKVGPATEIVSTSIAGGEALLAYSAQSGEQRFQALSAATWRPLSDHRYRALPGGALALQGKSASPLYLMDDYQTLVLKQAGEYDKKADVRQPDKLALLDTLSGKLRKTEPIADPTALAEQKAVLARHPGEAAFLHHDSDRDRLELWSASGSTFTRHALKTRRPLSVYDPQTLRYQALSSERLLFSLTVDPVNEAAVARKKRDPDTIDLCVVAIPDQTVRCLGEIPGKERPASWVVAADGTLVLLRKHRGFSRGGTEIEQYHLDVNSAKKAEAAP